jgi:hypothetical protein
MTRFIATTTTVLALALVACSSVVEPVRYASVSVANGTSGALTIKVDGVDVLAAQVPSGVSRAMMIPEGVHQVQLLDAADNAAVVTVRSIADTAHTVVAYPRIIAGAATGISTSVLADTGAIVPVGKSKLRVAHLAANAGNIEIWRSQPDFPSGVHIMTPFPYQATSPYLQSDPGTWEVWLTAAGSQVRTVSSGPIQIPSGERRTVLLVDGAGGPRFTVVTE